MQVKKAEYCLKAGLIQLDLAKKASESSTMAHEHVSKLKGKLKELDGLLGKARHAINFKQLDGEWCGKFPEKMQDCMHVCKLLKVCVP